MPTSSLMTVIPEDNKITAMSLYISTITTTTITIQKQQNVHKTAPTSGTPIYDNRVYF